MNSTQIETGTEMTILNNRTPISALILLVLAGLVSPGIMQAQPWEQVYPAWAANNLNGVVHWNGDTAYAYGYNWTLLRTVDAGETWEEMFNYDNGINILSAVRQGRSLIFKIYGESIYYDSTRFHLYRYNVDSGETDSIFVLKTYARYSYQNAIIMGVSDELIMLVEQSDNVSVLHRSSDGGETWDMLPLSRDIYTGAGWNAIEIVDAQTAFIVAGDSIQRGIARFVFTSTDGGETWTKYPGFVMPSGIVRTIFSPTEAGIVCLIGNGKQVWKSTDTCKTWIETAIIPWNPIYNSEMSGITIANENTFFVLGSESDVYKTTDAGMSWIQVKDAVQGASAANGIITAGNDETVLVCNLEGHFYRSPNGGITWDAIRMPEIRSIDPIHFFDSQNGILVSFGYFYDRGFFRTSDGGRTWTRLTVPESVLRWGFHYNAQGHVYSFFKALGSGSQALLQVSTDMGTSWSLIKEWEADSLPQLGELSVYENLLFIKYDSGTYYSYDNGTTWKYAAITDSLNIESEIHFAEDSDGKVRAYCIGQYRSKFDNLWYVAVHRSDDSCKTWNRIATPWTIMKQVQELDVISVDTIIYRGTGTAPIGAADIVMMTTDGGNSWTEILHEKNTGMNWTQYFSSKTYAVTIGSQSLAVYVSNNLLKTRELQFAKYCVKRGPAFFLDTEQAWIVVGPAIFRTTTGGVDWVEQPFTVREAAAISSIYPNPVTAGQQVNIDVTVGTQPFEAQGGRAVSLPRATPLRVTVYDLLGRMVATLYNGPAEPGTRTLNWQPAATLPAGMYVVRMALGENIWAKQVAVVR